MLVIYSLHNDSHERLHQIMEIVVCWRCKHKNVKDELEISRSHETQFMSFTDIHLYTEQINNICRKMKTHVADESK